MAQERDALAGKASCFGLAHVDPSPLKELEICSDQRR